jgi:hypothetical protein
MRYRIACAYFVLVATILGFGAALAYLLFQVVFSRFTPLALVLLLTASCAHPKPAVAVAGQPTHVVLEAWVEGSTPFCVEHPQMNGFFDQPLIKTGTICRVTVDDVRHWIAGMRSAD